MVVTTRTTRASKPDTTTDPPATLKAPARRARKAAAQPEPKQDPPKETKTTRGRKPAKAAEPDSQSEPEPQKPAKATRTTRATKKLAPEPKAEPTEPAKPARATRATKKVEAEAKPKAKEPAKPARTTRATKKVEPEAKPEKAAKPTRAARATRAKKTIEPEVIPEPEKPKRLSMDYALPTQSTSAKRMKPIRAIPVPVPEPWKNTLLQSAARKPPVWSPEKLAPTSPTRLNTVGKENDDTMATSVLLQASARKPPVMSPLKFPAARSPLKPKADNASPSNKNETMSKSTLLQSARRRNLTPAKNTSFLLGRALPNPFSSPYGPVTTSWPVEESVEFAQLFAEPVGEQTMDSAHSMDLTAPALKSSLKSPEKKVDTKTPRKFVTFEVAITPEVKSDLDSYINDGPLQGTIVYLDVTSDGKDMAHLFVPVLEEMGAEVVPQWTSNNMPLTHVIFKDGEQRTLEKVVATDGEVKCVNVGWALDCERMNQHLDETNYLVNLSHVPGHTPRRPLSAFNTPIASRFTPAKTPSRFTPGNGPTPLHISTQTPMRASPCYDSDFLDNDDTEDKENTAPAESAMPYYLQPNNLVQQTAPVKRSIEMAFPSVGAMTPFKKRLVAAKRRSAEFQPTLSTPFMKQLFAPKISSPLRRIVS